MDAIQRLLSTVELPKMFRARQSFPVKSVADVRGAVFETLATCPAYAAIEPGMRLAITVGSRGLSSLPVLVRALVDALRAKSAVPFVIPAMGSHGGGSAEGQREMLATLGVSEQSVGCPVRSSMEVVRIGALADGFPVYMDRFAYEADGVVLFNRIKPHNGFRARHESGLLKMLAIGLGKHKGAESSHTLGFGQMGRIIEEVSSVVLQTGKVKLALGTIENSRHQVGELVACGPDDLFETDEKGLQTAWKLMPRLLVDSLDLLIVNEIGKEFSGGGMDNNIVGRYSTPFIHGGPEINKIVALDLTDKSKGNASGMGVLDFIPDALVGKIDLEKTYTNNLTSKATASGRIPIHLPTEEMVIRAGLKTCTAPDAGKARVMRIKNTLELEEVLFSEALLPEAREHPSIEILGDPEPMRFGADGKLAHF
ncbi:MAG: nickel-dependent lactate racemase [Candidatus Accumulibacter sp.]|jgi:hypothetical protein|nr:nickel-dependent lactate racemase [Accumulibacter sp.]